MEQLNATERQGGDLKQPKNHVEHECIPPSIRDFKNLTSSEQVDLQQKLQEDPLVSIKKQEEETRRRLLQNPVQLKKLQDVLKMKSSKKKKKKKKSKSDDELDTKLAEKYSKLKGHLNDGSVKKETKKKKDSDLDRILLEKLKLFKDKYPNKLEDLLKVDSESNDSDSDSNKKDKRKNNKQKKGKQESSSSSDDDDSEDNRKYHRKKKLANNENFNTISSKNFNSENRKISKDRDRSTSSTSSDENRKRSTKSSKTNYNEKLSNYHKTEEQYKPSTSKSHPKHTYSPCRSKSRSPQRKKTKHETNSEDNSDEERQKPKIVNYGLVKADGSKIALSKKSHEKDVKLIDKSKPVDPKYERRKREKLSEEEIEKRRNEMMQNAKWRDTERVNNVKRYKEADRKESNKNERDYNPDFLKDQLRKSASSNTVESRIKANINNIQRSSRDMNTHFSRRY